MHFSWRQEDQTFVNALNVVRFGDYPKDVRKLFRPCVGRELDMPTHLVCTNKEADEINFARLLAHKGTEYIGKPIFSIEKRYITPDWASDIKAKMAKDSLTDNPLRIKVGVPVLLLKNQVDGQYVNGTRGIVDSVALFEHGEINFISVKHRSSEISTLPVD